MDLKNNEINDILGEIEANEKHNNNNDLLDWIRSKWTIGSLCEIYSNSAHCWVEGTIKRIFTDSDGKWFEIENSVKVIRVVIKSSSKTIRPLSKAMEIYKYIYASINNKVPSTYDTSSPNVITKISEQESKEINSTKLRQYLIKHVDEFKENKSVKSLSISKFTTGYVNPPYLLTYGNQKYVLRKGIKPSYNNKISAEDFILKQYKIMSAIGKHTDIPVPKMLIFCHDTSIIGAPFYVMEFVQGRVIKHEAVDLASWTAKDRQEIYTEMIKLIAKIHCVDYHKLGLTEFIQGDFEWSKEGYLNAFNNEHAVNHEFHKNCERHKNMCLFENCMKKYKYLKNNSKTLVHGDMHFENVIFDPVENKILAVLDWEFCTIGDPLFDLSYFTGLWRLGHSKEMIWTKDEIPAVWRGNKNAINIGIPSESDALQIYVDSLSINNGKNIELHVKNINYDWNFYCALQLYRCVAVYTIIYTLSPDSKLATSFGNNLFDYFAVLGKNVLNRDKIRVEYDNI